MRGALLHRIRPTKSLPPRRSRNAGKVAVRPTGELTDEGAIVNIHHLIRRSAAPSPHRGRNTGAAHCFYGKRRAESLLPSGARGVRKSQTAWLFPPSADAAVPQRMAFRPTGELTDEGKAIDSTKQIICSCCSLITQLLCRAELPPREAFVIAPSPSRRKKTREPKLPCICLSKRQIT